jgi:hypothetical protein
MDILFSKLTLFAIAIVLVTAFIVYSVTAIRRVGSAAYFKAVAQVCNAFAKTMAALATTLIGFLASGTRTPDSNESSENAAHDGVLNYRSGKLDDGTDATGWYEKD